ncbi:DapH/DapD/GlmU-related protein [Methanoregula sp.]|uniref:DapH/DapD/GlmU-related protein n=1 Tax=Methanoregula sp. TaxID=2052170 RepID=UPI0026257BC6|nr:DapH/DapD/GlmU-related protein [Methanoregula sp.]MDD5141915.1 DapH/DapD/GlmU-related protein [Methanoregula sp.]
MIPGNLQQFQTSFRMVESTLIGFPSPAALKSEIFPGVRLGADPSIGRHCIIYGNVFIGDRFRCGNDVLIRSETALGDDVTLCTGTCIDMDVVIGNNVTVREDVWIPRFTRIGDNVEVGAGVRLVGEPEFSSSSLVTDRAIVLGEGCVIGKKAIIAPGVSIGVGAVVDEGAVVTSDIPANPERAKGN